MTIQTIQQKTIPIFQHYGISYAGLFGSFARGQETDASDVDFIIRLGRPMGMIAYVRFLDELESSLQRNVDVVTEKSINKHIKPYILSDLKKIYEAR